ncbi:MAG: hypothetical protein M3406_08655 [Chloroflexota bacterium]|nr:hypothetical protein [Chloroflexota bacterium]
MQRFDLIVVGAGSGLEVEGVEIGAERVVIAARLRPWVSGVPARSKAGFETSNSVHQPAGAAASAC